MSDPSKLFLAGMTATRESIAKAMAQTLTVNDTSVSMADLMHSEAYWDPNHPFHESTVTQVRLMHEQALPAGK